MKPKERPLVLKDFEVRAILDGRKTQMRRVVKPQPVLRNGIWYKPGRRCDSSFYKEKLINGKLVETSTIEPPEIFEYWPQHKVGDRLWVRETWCHAADDDDRMKYNADGNLDSSCCHYRADGYEVRHVDGEETKNGQPRSPWIPSIHMPRWASRITLEITGVRVERLQHITPDQVQLEGFRIDDRTVNEGGISLLEQFARSWESINGPDSWATNPWVWVIELKRV